MVYHTYDLASGGSGVAVLIAQQNKDHINRKQRGQNNKNRVRHDYIGQRESSNGRHGCTDYHGHARGDFAALGAAIADVVIGGAHAVVDERVWQSASKSINGHGQHIEEFKQSKNFYR